MSSPSSRESQFSEWLARYRGILVKVARSFAAEPADQEELVQRMAVQLWHSMAGFGGRSSPATWIYRICLNTALNWRRSERRRESTSPLDKVPETPDFTPPPNRATESSELLDLVYREIRRLPAAERTLTILHLDGLSYREIGEITGLSENRVGVALTRIRHKLAEALKEVHHEL